jgi:8-oxo-dGTP pyrophosphatase MutT (NUDIX family)
VNLLERVRAARAWDRSKFTRFFAAGVPLGWIRRDQIAHLAHFPRVFRIADDAVTLAEEYRDCAARTRALAAAVSALAAQGHISGWRDETYAVAEHFGDPPLFHLERAAVRMFGLTSYAVHVNGVVGAGDGCRMWIARRSPAKPIDPGLLDNLIGGGLASGLSVEHTLAKEGWEEAGLERAHMLRARRAGSVRLLREVPEGLQSEVIFTHDLELPADFIPTNQDGEVAEFRLLPLADVCAMLKTGGEFTLDASLVILEFLLRRGYIDREEPNYAELTSAFAEKRRYRSAGDGSVRN